jgi:hypothetical protein
VLRSPVVVAGGVLLLAIGFAAGYVVGHDRGSAAAGTSSSTQVGPGRLSGGGFGQGQGQPGFGGGQQNQPGQ